MGGSQSADTDGVGGFRVFKVTPSSPAAEAGLEVFFDFITEIGGTAMDANHETFFQKIKESENTRTKLVVFNIRTQTSREVVIVPRRWGGSGLLGAVVRYDSLDNVESQGLRVVQVFPNSPAAEAGLIPFKDYLLGTPEVMLRDMDELVEIVSYCTLDEEKQGRVQLYVYNSDTESIREVAMAPRRGWGGDGLMGADIRTGILHRIPPPRRPFQIAPQMSAAAAAAVQFAPDDQSGPSVASLLGKFGGGVQHQHPPQQQPRSPQGSGAPDSVQPQPPQPQPGQQPGQHMQQQPEAAAAVGASAAGAASEAMPAQPAPTPPAPPSEAPASAPAPTAPDAAAAAPAAAIEAGADGQAAAAAGGSVGGAADGRPAAVPPLALSTPAPPAAPAAPAPSPPANAAAATAAAAAVVAAAAIVQASDLQCYGAFYELTPGVIHEACEAK